MFGILCFDISSDSARQKVWHDLKGKVIRATDSQMTFDYAFVEEVERVVRKHAAPTDNVFRTVRCDERDEEKIREWVRIAMEKFFAEVTGRIKVRLIKIIERVDKPEGDEDGIGVLDGCDRVDRTVADIKAKVDDAMVALATFRLSEEFAEFRDGLLKTLDAEQELAGVELMKRQLTGDKADRVEKKDKAA